MAPQLARVILLVILGIYVFTALINTMTNSPGPTVLALSVICVGVMFGMQLLHSSPGAAQRSVAARSWSLGIQAAATFLPLVIFEKAWVGMAGPLASSMLLLLPTALGWSLFLALAASPLVTGLWISFTFLESSYLVASTLLSGLVIYGLTRLTDLVHEVHSARAELARMAVTQERLRFARDLHDLLGYSLSAITLKSELTHRLVLARPERARDEIDSILQISRQALADVRMVASGYRDMSLASEAESAKSMLEATGIGTRLDYNCRDLHPAIETVLATTLREGVTNILRHSKVQHCTLELHPDEGGVRMTLVNDGVHNPVAPPARHGGSGLGNLASRVAAVGGRLVAGVQEDEEHFRLTVWTPREPIAGQRRRPGTVDGESGQESAA